MSKGGKSVSFKVPTSKLATVCGRLDRQPWRRACERSGRGHRDRPEARRGCAGRGTEGEDVPLHHRRAESLHRRVKMQCAARGQKMADVMRDLLERAFPAS